MKPRVGNRDRCEPAIVRALRGVGAVVVLHGGRGEPDMFVGLRGRWHALELKEPAGPRGGTSSKRLTKEQQAFHLVCEAAGLPIAVVHDPMEALAAVGVEIGGSA